MKTEVIFRVDDGEILAVFPYNSGKDHLIECYAHTGQHSWCAWDYITRCTKPATPAQYADLKAELEGLGYDLKVLQKPCHRKNVSAMKEYAIGEVFERDGVLLSAYSADLKRSGEIRKDGEDVILKHAEL